MIDYFVIKELKYSLVEKCDDEMSHVGEGKVAHSDKKVELRVWNGFVF